jgi:hypothetical protein
MIKIYRACSSAYATLISFWSIPFFLSLYDFLVVGRDSFPLVLLLVLLLVVICIWLYFYEVIILEDEIKYKSFLGGTKSLSFSEITDIRVVVGIKKYGDQFKPLIRLTIHPSAASHKEAIEINMKVFSANDLKEIRRLLQEKSNIQFDQTLSIIKRMRDRRHRR